MRPVASFGAYGGDHNKVAGMRRKRRRGDSSLRTTQGGNMLSSIRGRGYCSAILKSGAFMVLGSLLTAFSQSCIMKGLHQQRRRSLENPESDNDPLFGEAVMYFLASFFTIFIGSQMLTYSQLLSISVFFPDQSVIDNPVASGQGRRNAHRR